MRIGIGLMWLVLLHSVASAEGRFALLIGNQAYSAKVGPLKNPHSDVALVGAALRSLGFTVTEVRDADYRSTDAAIKRYVATVRHEGQGAISFVYYSGHGAADPDTKINYLIPIDVANADDDDLWNYSINLNTLVESLRAQAPGATHYVVFDACRNELNLTRRGQKALTDKGFVPMAYTPGVMVAYATAPGRTASDGGKGGGPYAKALADEIVKPGIDSMLVFTRVARRVQQELGQDPFLSASTMPEIYFAGNRVSASAPSTTARQPDTGELERAWTFIKDTEDQSRLEEFIKQFGDTPYAPMARSRLEELRRRQAMPAPPNPSSSNASWGTPDSIRETLYRTILSRMASRTISMGTNSGDSTVETYRAYSHPKAMVICIDWSATTPGALSQHSLWAHIFSGDGGCKGLSSRECERHIREYCKARSKCESDGERCLVVDVNGRNAIVLDRTWLARFSR
jgi:caspase domain-containing protein